MRCTGAPTPCPHLYQEASGDLIPVVAITACVPTRVAADKSNGRKPCSQDEPMMPPFSKRRPPRPRARKVCASKHRRPRAAVHGWMAAPCTARPTLHAPYSRGSPGESSCTSMHACPTLPRASCTRQEEAATAVYGARSLPRRPGVRLVATRATPLHGAARMAHDYLNASA